MLRFYKASLSKPFGLRLFFLQDWVIAYENQWFLLFSEFINIEFIFVLYFY